MKPNRYYDSFQFSVFFLIVALFLQGCVSLQIPAENGRPKLIGFGYTKSVGGAKGEVYQIIAPGLSMRVGSGTSGISFGWHEVRLFYPNTPENSNSSVHSIAFQTKCIGLDISLAGIMVGTESVFEIPIPNQSKHVIQFIAYAEIDPTNTIVEQKEIK